MTIKVYMLDPSNVSVLEHVAEGVFDNDVNVDLRAEFLNDTRHHLAIAQDGDTVIGMASAVDYIHPDKPAELWINEVGVSPDYQRSGIGRKLIQTLLEKSDELGCREVWVLAEGDDDASQKFYRSIGGDPSSLVMYTFYRKRGVSEKSSLSSK